MSLPRQIRQGDWIVGENGYLYAVTRITLNGQRGTIDLISLDDAVKRRDSLAQLVATAPKPGDES